MNMIVHLRPTFGQKEKKTSWGNCLACLKEIILFNIRVILFVSVLQGLINDDILIVWLDIIVKGPSFGINSLMSLSVCSIFFLFPLPVKFKNWSKNYFSKIFKKLTKKSNFSRTMGISSTGKQEAFSERKEKLLNCIFYGTRKYLYIITFVFIAVR